MPHATSLLHRTTEPGSEVVVRWDSHKLVAAHPGDTVSAALLGAGVLATSRSLKYRRPRGPFCLAGDCGTCLVRIDGVPNQRACMTAVRTGMQIEPQNRVVRGGGPDPTALADKIFAKGIDHHHLMVRPRIANQIMQSVARNLAGLGRLPDREARAASAPEHVRPDALVVGAGASGRAAAAAIRQAGYTCLLLDRLDAAGLHQQVAESPGTRLQTAVFGAYADDGVWAATGLGESGEARLLTVSPRHVVIATGARIPMLPVPNNDVPGVLAARGLIALLERSGATLVGPCVVIGEGEPASTAAAKLGAACVAPGAVETILGSTRVSGVKTRDGTIDCTVVALAPTPSPASELARQAGAHVHWDGSGFAVVRDEHGRCTSADAAGLWACGEVCGPMSRAEAAHDGRRVGEAVGEVLGARRGPA